MKVVSLPKTVNKDLIDGLRRLVFAAESGSLTGFVGVLSFDDNEQGIAYYGDCLTNVPGAIGQCYLLMQRIAKHAGDEEDIE